MTPLDVDQATLRGEPAMTRGGFHLPAFGGEHGCFA
jgi:hypothetical protein